MLLGSQVHQFITVSGQSKSHQYFKVGHETFVILICVLKWRVTTPSKKLPNRAWESPGILLKNFECYFRSSRPEVFCEKVVLKNFAKFTGKHLCQSLRTPPVVAFVILWETHSLAMLSNRKLLYKSFSRVFVKPSGQLFKCMMN